MASGFAPGVCIYTSFGVCFLKVIGSLCGTQLFYDVMQLTGNTRHAHSFLLFQASNFNQSAALRTDYYPLLVTERNTLRKIMPAKKCF